MVMMKNAMARACLRWELLFLMWPACNSGCPLYTGQAAEFSKETVVLHLAWVGSYTAWH